MNERERFLRYTEFRSVDRPPRWEWHYRGDTTGLWRKQGLPADVPSKLGWVEYFGLDRGGPWMEDHLPTNVGIYDGPVPRFADEIVGEDERYVTKKGAWGATGRTLKDGSAGMPQFLSFAVTDRKDFREMSRRLDPHDPSRYPADWEKRKAVWLDREWPIFYYIHGWYGLLRELMGMEHLSVSFYDQPDLIEEICEFWTDFIIRLFDTALGEIDADYVLFWEDLAFKNGPLLSPELFKRFILPGYRRVIDHFRRHGVTRFMVDSDGDIDLITPLWLDAGINILGPYEVSAGMDVVRVAKEYPDLILVGGIDKMEIAKGPRAVEEEVLRRTKPLLGRRGYFPTLDHSTIPELSLDDYHYYRRFLTEVWEEA